MQLHLVTLCTLCLAVGSALALQVPAAPATPYRAYPTYQQQVQQYQQYQRQYQQQQQFQQYLRAAAAAPILQYSNDVNPDGSFQYSYQTGNGIQAQAAGYTRNLGIKDAEAQVVQGSYSYTGPDGKVYTVNYIADENGYRAEGGHLPSPPAAALVKNLPYYQQPLQVLNRQPYAFKPFQRRF